jgi:hypothetical protein
LKSEVCSLLSLSLSLSSSDKRLNSHGLLIMVILWLHDFLSHWFRSYGVVEGSLGFENFELILSWQVGFWPMAFKPIIYFCLVNKWQFRHAVTLPSSYLRGRRFQASFPRNIITICLWHYLHLIRLSRVARCFSRVPIIASFRSSELGQTHYLHASCINISIETSCK